MRACAGATASLGAAAWHVEPWWQNSAWSVVEHHCTIFQLDPLSERERGQPAVLGQTRPTRRACSRPRARCDHCAPQQRVMGPPARCLLGWSWSWRWCWCWFIVVVHHGPGTCAGGAATDAGVGACNATCQQAVVSLHELRAEHTSLVAAVTAFCESVGARPAGAAATLCAAASPTATKGGADAATCSQPRGAKDTGRGAGAPLGGANGRVRQAAGTLPRAVAALLKESMVPAGSAVFLPGGNFCAKLRVHCGGGREGAMCTKQLLQKALPVWRHGTMDLPPLEFFFLCSAFVAESVLDAVSLGNTPRSQRLTDLLHDAKREAAEGPVASLLEEYHLRARAAALRSWSPAEKLHHFLVSLTILPDNAHFIDRLAVALLAPGGGGEHARARSMLLHYAVLRRLINHPLQRPMVLYRTGLQALPFWHPNPPPEGNGAALYSAPLANDPALAWLAFLEDDTIFEQIRAEVLGVLDGLGTKHGGGGYGAGNLQMEGIHEDGAWSELHIIEEERVSKKGQAAERFPVTLRLIRKARFINARISVLQAGTHITPHCGVSNAKLRGHLGLRVPPVTKAENQAGTRGAHALLPQLRSGLRVGDQVREWEEGKLLVFDDSFEHEVWWRWAPNGAPAPAPAVHALAEARVVLIFDYFHPQLSPQDRAKIRSSYVSAQRATP